MDSNFLTNVLFYATGSTAGWVGTPFHCIPPAFGVLTGILATEMPD